MLVLLSGEFTDQRGEAVVTIRSGRRWRRMLLISREMLPRIVPALGGEERLPEEGSELPTLEEAGLIGDL